MPAPHISRRAARLLAILLLAAPAMVAFSQPVRATPTPALGDGSVRTIAAATRTLDFGLAFDSTPDRAGTTIYFTAKGAQGRAVYRVPTAGGAARVVARGAPLVSPRGIAATPDGQAVVVADPLAGGSGALVMVPLAGGQPHIVSGSEGTAPQNLVAMGGAGHAEALYFTGRDPATGLPAVLMLPLKGAAAPMVLFSGAPLAHPDGVAVTKDGTIYVADRAAAGAGRGTVFRLVGHHMLPIGTGLHLGNPAGIALSPQDAVLLVSSIQPQRTRAQVLLIDVHTLATGVVTKVVGANPGAGGLHAQPLLVQGRGQPLYSWCGVTVGGQGTVFQVTLH